MLLRLVRENLAPYKGAVAAVVILQFLQTAATLFLPTLNADIIDQGVVKGDTATIMNIGGWMLAVTAAQVVCSVAATYYAARTAMRVGRNVRRSLFTNVETFSGREIGLFGAPSLITRTTNDVQQVQMSLLLTMTMMVSAPIMGVGGVLLALNQDIPLSGILLLILPVLVIIIGLVLRRLVPLFRRAQKQIDRVNGVLREQIMGIAVIRAFVRERTEKQRFDGANQDLTGTQLRVSQYLALLFPATMLVANLATVAVVWLGAFRIDAGQMQIGALTAFIAYIMQILMAVMMSMFMIMMLPRAAVCAERIYEVLDTRTSVRDAPDAGELVYDGGRLVFTGVGFTYPGAEDPVLRDISFEAEPGQTTAIIGSTGAGKSTLLNLVPRLLDPTGEASALTGRTRPGSPCTPCAPASGWCRSVPISSPAPLPPTCVSASPPPRMRNCGKRWRSPRLPTLSGPQRAGWTMKWSRAAATSPADSASGWPLPGHWWSSRTSTSSMTVSPHWTSPRTPASGQP